MYSDIRPSSTGVPVGLSDSPESESRTWLADTLDEAEDLRPCGVRTSRVQRHTSTWDSHTHQNLRAETWPADTQGEGENLRPCGELPVYSERHTSQPLEFKEDYICETHQSLRAETWSADTPGEADLRPCGELPVYRDIRPSSYRSSCGTARPTRI